MAIAPDSTVPVTTVPTPVSVNERSTASRKRPCGALRSAVLACANNRLRSSSMPSPLTADTGTMSLPASAVLSSARDLRSHRLAPVGRDEIDLGHRDEPATDAEQVDDGKMLAGLGHDAVVGGDDQKHKIDAAGAGQHVVHELLVAWHIDKAEHLAVRRWQIGKAEIGSDAAGLFFLEAIGVDAGERPHQ